MATYAGLFLQFLPKARVFGGTKNQLSQHLTNNLTSGLLMRYEMIVTAPFAAERQPPRGGGNPRDGGFENGLHRERYRGLHRGQR